MKYCTNEAMQKLTTTDWSARTVPTASELAEALDESTSLAKAAFEQHTAGASDHVERLLYTIHTRTNFSPPLAPLPALCWSILTQAKLNAALSAPQVADEVSPDEMVKRLDEAVQQVEQRDHTLLDIITRAPDDKGLHVYAKNWFASTHGFTKQLFGIVKACHGVPQLGHLFDAAMENVNEECDPAAPHFEMRARFPKRLGIDYSPDVAQHDPQLVTQAFSLQNYRTAVCNLVDPTYALGSFYTIEAGFPGVCTRMYAGLKERGFDDDSIVVFKSHAGVDTEHADEWLHAIKDSPLTGRQRAQVLRGGLAQVELRHQMFVAMRRLLA